MKSVARPVTLGVIVGNRGFFPSHLCDSGRKTVLKVLQAEGIQAVCLGEGQSQFGAVFSLADSHQCSDLFRAHRDDIDGILVTLPNFGEETAIANAIRWAGLEVPVLVHAFPDDPEKMTAADRRDSFCGKMSCCNNLAQFGIRYSLTRWHTMDPEGEAFRADLRDFAAMCRMVRGLRTVRLGVIGARPAAFKTVRFSEKLLERTGISVETVDLSEIFGRALKLGDTDSPVKRKLDEITGYVPTGRVPPQALTKMAKLGVAIDGWMQENEVVATALQCWTAMEEFYGVVPCTLMSMMSNNLMPSACETDVAGLVGMYAMVLATEKPSAIVDWNNNYGDDPDKAVIFHCSNLPKDIFAQEGIAPEDIPTMDYQAIIAGTVGKENTYGTIAGRVRETPFTFCRVSPDDFHGRMRAYFGEGRLTNDPLRTFGGYGVVHIEALQKLLAHICEEGYEHHVAINPSRCASILQEGLGKYMGWDLYHHAGNENAR
jgi:L-fucose isomerase-like protein